MSTNKMEGKLSRRKCTGECLEMAFRYTSSEAYWGEAVMKAACDAKGRIKNRLQFGRLWTEVWKSYT